jgi:hypothetical protein
MKAIIQDRYGSPQDVLRLEDIGTPQAKDDEVLVHGGRARSGESRDRRLTGVIPRTGLSSTATAMSWGRSGPACSAQCAAVRKTVGEIRVPEQYSQVPSGYWVCATRPPTLGWL